MNIDPLDVEEYEVTITATNGDLSGVRVSLDLPGDWEYSGPEDLGYIAEGSYKRATFTLIA